MTDKAEDVVARLKSWATGSYDVELASARINVRDVRDALALIAAQAAEIAALKNDLDRLTRGTWSLEIARRSLMTADLRAELAAAKEALREQLQKAQSALQMTSDWFAAAQAEAELYLIPNNDCNQYWFVSRMLWYLDGPTQRTLKAAIDAATEKRHD